MAEVLHKSCDVSVCPDCTIKFSSEVNYKCLQCSLETLCPTCAVIHCRKDHDVSDNFENQPELCGTHKNFLVFFCTNCDLVLCTECVADHLVHELVTVSSMVDSALLKVQEALETEKELIQPVQVRRDQVQLLLDVQKKVQRMYLERAVVGEVLETTRAVLNDVLDEKSPKMREINKTEKKLRRVDRSLRKSESQMEYYKEIASASPSKLIKATTRDLESPLQNISRSTLDLIADLTQTEDFSFDSNMYEKALKKVLANVLRTPLFPTLNFRPSSKYRESLDQPAKITCAPGLIGVMQGAVYYLDPHFSDKLSYVWPDEIQSKKVSIPFEVITCGDLKAIAQSPAQDSLICQFGNTLFRFNSNKKFERKSLAHLQNSDTLLCVTEKEVYFWREVGDQRSLILARQWSLGIIHSRDNSLNLPRLPYSRATSSGFCGFLAGKELVDRGSTYCEGAVAELYRLSFSPCINVSVPHKCFCLMEHKNQKYLIIHGIDPNTKRYVIRKVLMTYKANGQSNYGHFEKSLEVDGAFYFMEQLVDSKQLVCVDEEGFTCKLDFK